jgi:hypothetical protein
MFSSGWLVSNGFQCSIILNGNMAILFSTPRFDAYKYRPSGEYERLSFQIFFQLLGMGINPLNTFNVPFSYV